VSNYLFEINIYAPFLFCDNLKEKKMEIENSLKNEFLVKKNNQHYVRLTNGIEMPMIGLGTSLRGNDVTRNENKNGLERLRGIG
jgi:hypothetical protein